MASMVDKLSPMKLMPWTKSSKEDTLEEINRKMQRALEEALMKNIHLQDVGVVWRVAVGVVCERFMEMQITYGFINLAF